MSLYNETTEILRKYRITANKKLGQNFLINEEVVNKIIDASNITKEDLVIEIGPGLGTLTKPLIEKAGKVICIELDERMIQILEERFAANLKIVNDDVLRLNLNTLIEEEKGIFEKVKIVANLPYYITTPIIMKLLEDRLDVESITVMIQKEVADRLTCNPGTKNTGAITYGVHYYTYPEEIYTVPKNSFIPEPEVTSEVIKLTLRKEPAVKVGSEKNLFKVIKVAFMQRRKTLLNGLTNSGLFTKEESRKILGDIGLPENIRGEKLSLEEFAKISEYIH